MCGIAGFIGTSEIPSGRIENTLALMYRRGPDHQAFEHITEPNRNIYLLHSRLAIIDLDSRSNQPFHIDDSALVFNGEIYNYRELRSRFADCRWRTNSDTEVLLHYYREYGINCVNQFEGMWAFAIYNRSNRQLFLSRDRFGEKPLYYWKRPEGLYFGSETKFLWALAGTKATINLRHLCRYLVNGYKSLYKNEELFFEEIKQLPFAGSMLVDADNQLQIFRHWNPQADPTEMSAQEAIDGFKERFLRSLDLRLRADVPLAFCLSGGIDSNAIVCAAAKVFGYDVATFSIVDSDPRYNEQENIDSTIKELKCRHHFIHVKPDNQLDRLKELVEYHDSPVSTISYLVHSHLSTSIADHGYRVVCMGTAADELITGYYDHFNLHLYEMREHPDFLNILAAWKQYQLPNVRNPYLQNPRLYFDNVNFSEHIYLNRHEFSKMMRQPFDEPYTMKQYSNNRLHNRMLNELFHEGTHVILHEDDLNSMMYSIENRSPFLDTELFNFSYSIPIRHLIVNGYAKFILREAMKDIIPNKVRLDRRKRGFNASINSIVDFSNPTSRKWILADSPVWQIVKREAIAKIIDSSASLPNSYSKFFFNFLNVKIFLENN